MRLAWRGLGRRARQVHVVEEPGDEVALCGYRVAHCWDLDPWYSWNRKRVTCVKCLAALEQWRGSLIEMFGAASAIVETSGSDLTVESMVKAIETLHMRDPGPCIEVHHPECPKLISGGKDACRCGACSLESVFEDELRGKR